MGGAMRGHSRALHFVRRLTPALLAFLLVVVSGAAFALDTSLTSRPSTPMGPSGGHYLGQGNWLANGQHTGYYSKQYGIPWSKLGQVGKAALRGVGRFSNAAGLAYTALQLGGYGYDALNDLVHQNDGTPAAPLGTYAYCFTAQANYGVTSAFCVNLGASFCTAFTARSTLYNCTGTRGFTQGVSQFVTIDLVHKTEAGNSATAVASWTLVNGSYQNGNPSTPPTPVSDDVFGQKMAQAAGPSLQSQSALINDPYGNPHRFQEYVDAENALAQQLAQQTQTNVVTSTDPVIDPATATGDPSQNATPDNLPAFCSWATVVCDFITWFKTEPEIVDVPLPEEEAAISHVEWSSGVAGAGACPAPTEVTVPFAGHSGTFSFSLQWLCDIAATLRQVLIGIALVFAAYWIAGVRRA